jgi:hypothetical protein
LIWQALGTSYKAAAQQCTVSCAWQLAIAAHGQRGQLVMRHISNLIVDQEHPTVFAARLDYDLLVFLDYIAPNSTLTNLLT